MSEEIQTTEVEKVVEMQGKTVFSLTEPKPRWATIVFRTQFILNKMLMLYLSGTSLVPSANIKEVFLIMGAIDLGTWLLANSLGVKKKDLGFSEDEN